MADLITPPNIALGPNMQGMLDGIRAMMMHLCAPHDTSSVPSLEELYAISSFGVRHYAYEPQYNAAYDPPRLLSPWSEWFSNYGALESVGYYTGYELSELNFISEDDFWNAMMFELDHGRLVLSMGLHGTVEPVLVVGYEQSSTTRVLHIRVPEQHQPVSVNLWGVEHAQGDNGVFDNWLVLVRPTSTPAWDKPANQRFTLVKWLVDHGNNVREFFHETRENYVVADRAYQRMERLFLEEISALNPQHVEGILSLAIQVQAYRQSMAVGRRATASVLARWAKHTTEISKFNAEQAQRAQDTWAQASTCYAVAAECFELWTQQIDDANILSPEGCAAALTHLAGARKAEAQALVLLERSVEGVSLFGG